MSKSQIEKKIDLNGTKSEWEEDSIIDEDFSPLKHDKEKPFLQNGLQSTKVTF